MNDTYEYLETFECLHQPIDSLDRDLLIWNGDTCNGFNPGKSTEQILLNPARNIQCGWAATRPLLFSNGNHDVCGARAREVPKSLAGCPDSVDLPYCQLLRCGAVAILTLDTGEDKPDRHPVFAGTAMYEPYREQQAKWLKSVIDRPDVTSAPFKVVACHIPLRGLEGQDDGTTLTDFTRFSGFGAKLWLPMLINAGFHAILSGHTHQDRLDPPTAAVPIHQFVGIGPKPESAALTIIDVRQESQAAEMEIRTVNLVGQVLHRHTWKS